MKIDLFKLNNYGSVAIDEDITFSKDYYEKMDIRDIKNTHVKGSLKINYADELECSLDVKGIFVLPCAITLEDVLCEFSTKIEENLGNFNNFYDKNKNTLDILPFIWENIVSEVPIRVVKDGVVVNNVSGNGWELVSED